MKNVIEIDLDNKDEYINKYDDSKISTDLHLYIINSMVDINKEIIIKVKFNFSFTLDDRNVFREMLYSDFRESLYFIHKEILSANFRNFILFIIGVVCFFLSFFFKNMDMELLSEFF